MKNLLIIIIFLFSINLYSQNKGLYKCDELKKIIFDETLFDTLSNGKLVARFDRHINKIYKIVLQKNKFYYVGKPIMKRIKRSIRINNCSNIKIVKIDNIDFKIKRD
jgi:hypothetical protein